MTVIQVIYQCQMCSIHLRTLFSTYLRILFLQQLKHQPLKMMTNMFLITVIQVMYQCQMCSIHLRTLFSNYLQILFPQWLKHQPLKKRKNMFHMKVLRKTIMISQKTLLYKIILKMSQLKNTIVISQKMQRTSSIQMMKMILQKKNKEKFFHKVLNVLAALISFAIKLCL